MEDQTIIRGIACGQIRHLAQIALSPGADLLLGITEALSHNGIRNGVIFSGVGALERAVFRNLKRRPTSFPVRDADRLYLEVTTPLELIGLSGWAAPREDGRAEVHAHFAASTVQDDRIVTFGGHLTPGTVCGIKVAVAVLVLDEGQVYAGIDPVTMAYDLAFK